MVPPLRRLNYLEEVGDPQAQTGDLLTTECRRWTKMSANDPYVLARKPAARFMGVSDRRFAELTKCNDFPRALQLGGPRSCRWLRSELEAYVCGRPRRTVG